MVEEFYQNQSGRILSKMLIFFIEDVFLLKIKY